MHDRDKTYTLEQFWLNKNLPNGLYAVWVNKLIFDDVEKPLNGLKYSIAIWDEKSGFSDDLDWTENFDEREIKVKFLEELAIDDYL